MAPSPFSKSHKALETSHSRTMAMPGSYVCVQSTSLSSETKVTELDIWSVYTRC